MINRRNLLKAVSGAAGLSLLPGMDAAYANGPGSIIWTYAPGEEGLGRIMLGDGTLYTATDETVYAVDTGTGSERWRFAVEVGTRTSTGLASIGDETVYVRSGGRFTVTNYAIDIASGTERWRLETESVGTFAPIEADGIVFVGNDGFALCALDPITAEEQWRFTTMDAATASPLVDRGILYVGSFDMNLYALNATTGSELWRFTAGDRVTTPEEVINDVMYVASADGHVYALDSATGAERWRSRNDSQVIASPIVANGTVYIRDFDFTIHALDAMSGAERWRVPFDAQVFISEPAEFDGAVVLGSYDGLVRALDAATGSERWRFEVRGSVATSPLVAESTAYFSDNNGTFYAVDAISGTERWRLDQMGTYYSPLVVDDVLFLTSGGGIHAIVAEPAHYLPARADSMAITLEETPLRAAPLTTGNVITTLKAGTELEVTGETVETGGVTWWPVSTSDGKTGWVDGGALRRG